MIKKCESFNEKQTEKIGKSLGKFLKPGDFLALIGDLGAGKTVFVRGIARGMGVQGEITSPTFTIINEYQGVYPLAHMDTYRLDDPEIDLENVGYYDYLKNHVIVMEWADRAIGLLPEQLLWIKIDTVDDVTRRISFKPIGRHYMEIIQEMDV
ncbi:MAG: tRNA (adenosine(37)-N6)-threonylcarbamoyltransferase complex ATPase subunit type 1 TsaE [Tepidanaerobacteraceae bacterium]|jgi:tRNA threonylcarbamoyladenosine biosynthesis protein TsaE